MHARSQWADYSKQKIQKKKKKITDVLSFQLQRQSLPFHKLVFGSRVLLQKGQMH